MAIYCPACQRNDQVKKVTAIVADGTWSDRVYSGNPYQGWYNTTNSTQLVKNLLANQPPKKGFHMAPGLSQITGLIFFLCFGALGALGDPNFRLVLGGLIGVMILLLVISVVQHARNRRQWTNDHALWQQNFNRQYYCFRDDIVFYIYL